MNNQLDALRQAAIAIGHTMSPVVDKTEACKVLGFELVIVSQCDKCEAVVNFMLDCNGFGMTPVLSAVPRPCIEEEAENGHVPNSDLSGSDSH